MEKFAGYTGLFLLVAGFILLVISVQKGKKMLEYMKLKYPQKWDEMGNPSPGYLQSINRTRWMKFIREQEYRQFKDQKLTDMGEAQRKIENFTLATVLAFIFIFGGLALCLEFSG